MAVLDTLPGVRVWITANEEYLKKYSYSSEDLTRPLANKMVVSYIEAVSGMNFAVKLEHPLPFKFNRKSIGFLLGVDGKEVRTVSRERTGFQGKWTDVVEGAITALPDGKLGISKFSFAETKTGICDSFNPFSTADIIWPS